MTPTRQKYRNSIKFPFGYPVLNIINCNLYKIEVYSTTHTGPVAQLGGALDS